MLDGQLVLLEISQQDGAWPRSQLQSTFEAEEEEAQAGTSVRDPPPSTNLYCYCFFCLLWRMGHSSCEAERRLDPTGSQTPRLRPRSWRIFTPFVLSYTTLVYIEQGSLRCAV